MIFRSLIENKRNLLWTIFHVVLGFVCVFTPFALIGWFYLLLASNFVKGLKEMASGKFFFFMSLMFYLVSFELLDRMAKTSPFIPYEVGKYFLLITAVLGLLFYGRKSNVALLMAFLLVPALFYDLSGKRVLADYVNNFFAPFSMAIGIAVFYKRKISSGQMSAIFKLIWLTALSALVYSFIKTPNFDEIDFGLKANFATTGGAASNQVSTLFGLGMFLSFYSVINRAKFSGYTFLDILIMFAFAFQGLLSFSRGGMMIGVICMACYYLFSGGERKSRFNVASLAIFVVLLGVGAVAFSIADQVTGGKLLLRYQGETAGTLMGSKQKDLNVITSGRVEIMTEDIELFLQHPAFGVGVGASSYMRFKDFTVAAHIEMSRLLADHGLLGLLHFILLLALFIGLFRTRYVRQNKNLFIALFLMAFLTTFHAAMRTYVSPMFFILAVLHVVPTVTDKKRVA